MEQEDNKKYASKYIEQKASAKDSVYINSIPKKTLGKDSQNIRSASQKENSKEIGLIHSIKAQNRNENNHIHSHDSKSSLKKPQMTFSTIINKIGSHNSYLGVTLHSIYHMTSFRDFILNDFEDMNNPLITQLKAILAEFSVKKRIDISSLSSALSEQFSDNEMFPIDKPNDCCDCLFAFINIIHSIHIKSPLNAMSSIFCNNSCFAHRYFWLNLTKVDECECTSSSESHCSLHNYITDIPLAIVLQYVKQKGLYDSNQKLFQIYQQIIHSTKVLCPLNGLNCNFCSTKRTLKANQALPQYLLFSYERLFGSPVSIGDILKSLFVIPKYYDFNVLFHPSNENNQKGIYKLFGFVFIKGNQSYTCAFKYSNTHNDMESSTKATINWVYYDDDNVYTLASLPDLVSLCLKNSLCPVLFYYKAITSPPNQKMTLLPYCSYEECRILEKYAATIDNSPIARSRFRPSEVLFFKENEVKRNTSHRKMHSHIIRNPTKGQYKVIGDDDSFCQYNCFNCNTTNRIECILCPNCGESNEKIIENTIKRRERVMNLPFAKGNHNYNSNNQDKVIDRPLIKEIIKKAIPIKTNSISIRSNYDNDNGINALYNEVKRNDSNNQCDNSDKRPIITPKEYKNYNLPKQINLKKTDNMLGNHTVMTKKNTNPQIDKADHIKVKSTEPKLNPNRIISPKTQKTPIQLINISDSSNIIFEEKIKSQMKIKAIRDSNNSNFLTNNNSKEYSLSKPQQVNMPFFLPEMWICANCDKVNKANEFKCLICGLINKKQRELIAQNEKRINKSLDANFTPSSREINLSNHQQQLTAPSHTINLNATFTKVSCACYSNYKTNIIKKGQCTVCNRVIDSSPIMKKGKNEEDKERDYLTKDSAKDKPKEIKTQYGKKPVSAQNRYESEDTVNNSMIKHIKGEKDSIVSPGYKRLKAEQGYKKPAQKKKN